MMTRFCRLTFKQARALVLLVATSVAVLLCPPVQAAELSWFEAARVGDTDALRRQFAAGVDINQVDASSRAALHHALGQLQSDTARWLIEAGADVNLVARGRSPLHWAIQAGDIEAVRLLISKGARAGESDDRGMSPLEQAVSWGRLDLVKEIGAWNRGGFTRGFADSLLELAAQHRHTDVVGYLLERGLDPGASRSGNVPLDVAAYLGELAIMDRLLAAGADVDAVSRGRMSGNSLGALRRTPLVTATLSNEREAVERLLRAGADPRALNGLAMVWADLKGDDEVYRALLKAGATEPEPFAFAAWLSSEARAGGKTRRETTSAGERLASAIAELGGWAADPAASFTEFLAVPEGTKVAIVTLDKDLANAESLLATRLSAIPGVVLLDRAETKRLVAARALDEMVTDKGGDARVGRLLGADVLVLLRSMRTENRRWLSEGRVVATRSGIVAGTSWRALSSEKIEPWIEGILGHCQTAGKIAGFDDSDRIYVAMPRVVAALNTPDTRELEHSLTLLLASHVARLPDIYLVEREEMDRLVLEQSEAEAVYQGSHWLLDASLEAPVGATGAGELKLVLVLRDAGGGDPVMRVVTAPKSDPERLVREALRVVADVFKKQMRGTWNAEAEARAFLVRAKRFERIFLWKEAGAAAEAAWGLGLRADEVTRLRLNAAVQRIQMLDKFLIPRKRQASKYAEVAELVAYRAPLLMPATDPREMELDEYIDLAHRALDVFSASLPGLGKGVDGIPAAAWLCGEVWDAATVPLRMSEPISYRRTHGDALEALRARLLRVHEEALAVARQRGDALAIQTLVGVKIKHLAWWHADEALFQAELRKLLAEATGWRPPLSEQSAWGAAWLVGKDHLRVVAGRGAQAWVRLARVLAKSEDVRERYLGDALLGFSATEAPFHLKAVQRMMEAFPRLNEQDRGINTLVYAMACQMKPEKPFVEIAMRPWYETALRDVKTSRRELGNLIGPADTLAAGMGGGVMYPEVLRFRHEQTALRLKTLKREGAGGVFAFSVTGEDAYELKPLYDDVLAILDGLRSREPQARYAFESLQLTVKHGFSPDQGRVVAEGLGVGKIRNPFVTFAEVPAAMKAGFAANLTSDVPWRAGTDGWMIAQLSAWDPDNHRNEKRLAKTFAFRMGADGEPVDVHELSGDAAMTYSEFPGGMGLRANDRWLVFAGRQRDASGRTTEKELIVATDLREGAWTSRSYVAASSLRGLRDMRIVGDRLIYSFVHNPTGPRSGGDEEMETSGDPTFGVIEIDLLTGEETLIASSRRQSVDVPVEGERLGAFRRISVIGDAAITFAGSEGVSAYAYDLGRREWRVLTNEDKTALAADADRNQRWAFVDAGGRMWRLYLATRKGALRVYAGMGSDFLDIPLSENSEGFPREYQPYRGALKKAARHRALNGQRITVTPHGLMIWLADGFHFWVPMEDVRTAIAAAAAGPTTPPAPGPEGSIP